LPTEDDILALRTQINETLAIDGSRARKALFEVLVQEIRVVGGARPSCTFGSAAST
jgi:hypothetical protein